MNSSLPPPPSPNGHAPSADTKEQSSFHPSSFIPHPSATGPKSSKGKRRSRRNAMKHGMCATDEVFLSALTRHERQVFENLRQTFHEHYHPEREQERLLVDRIAIEQFRLLRLYRIEHQAYRRDANTEQLRNSLVPYIDRFSRYEAHTNRILRVLHNRLLHLYYEQEAHIFKPMPTKE